MQLPKVLLCGAHPSLLHTLRTSGGHALQVEQVPHSVAFQDFTDRQNVGMLVVLHQLQSYDTPAIIRSWRRENPEVPVIAVTADYSGSTTRLLFIAGAADVLPLPAEPERILACYEAYLPGFGQVATRRKSVAHSRARFLLLSAMTPGLVIAGTGLAAPTPPDALPQNPVVQLQSTDCRGLRITYFGSFTVALNGRKMELTQQAKHLFAYLAYHRGRSLSRDHLARVFWPDKYDHSPEAARHSLKVEINRIRTVFGKPQDADKSILVFAQNCYGLDAAYPMESDVLLFKDLHHALQNYLRDRQDAPDALFQQAINIYSGNFLADFPEETFNWVEVERQHLSAVFEQMADLYSELLCQQGDHWKAAALCNEILSRDARMEAIHRRLMLCYIHLGMMNKVEAQFRLCCQMMRQEFDAQPSPETMQVYQQFKGKG